MGDARDRGRFDWLAELCGALAPAAAAGFAAFKLAPLFSFAPATALTASSLGVFALAFAAMRSVDPEPQQHELPEFPVEPIEPSELLLDDRYEEPDDALLLEDVLGAPDPTSRVVQLFAPEAMPTAGQLKARIDRHLANGPQPASEPIPTQAPDASDALYAALAELRRSLR